MNDNKDLEDPLNELERVKLQKRIAELEAELGNRTSTAVPEAKANVAELEPKAIVKEKPAGMSMWVRIITVLVILTILPIAGVIILNGGGASLASRIGSLIGSTPTPTPGPGCTDPKATNYNATAISNNGTCQYPLPPVPGCTNKSANNYDPAATVNDGLCIYLPMPSPGVPGCTDANASNHDPAAEVNDGTCNYPPAPILGCTNNNATNFNPTATVNDGSCIYPDGQVFGCPDINASNYNQTATINNHTCEYELLSSVVVAGCVDPYATNYDPAATRNDGSCVFPPLPVPGCMDSKATNFNAVATGDDRSCKYPPAPVLGCMDPIAINYEEAATVSDGTCQYPPPPGCTDPYADNFDPAATMDDHTCQYPPLLEPGCTDPYADNFESQAGWNDGSCKYTIGCTNPNATNFDPSASLENGTCTTEVNTPFPKKDLTGLPVGSGPEAYQYWQGDIPNSIYRYDLFGELSHQFSGKPFMIIKYNNITQEILDVEFGLSEVTQVQFATSTFAGFEWPLLNIDESWMFQEIFHLKSPIITLVYMDLPLPEGGELNFKSIVQGVQQFSFVTYGNGIISGVGDEQYTFTYTSSIMTGGVTNLDTEFFRGFDSEANAFHLLRIK